MKHLEYYTSGAQFSEVERFSINTAYYVNMMDRFIFAGFAGERRMVTVSELLGATSDQWFDVVGINGVKLLFASHSDGLMHVEPCFVTENGITPVILTDFCKLILNNYPFQLEEFQKEWPVLTQRIKNVWDYHQMALEQYVDANKYADVLFYDSISEALRNNITYSNYNNTTLDGGRLLFALGAGAPTVTYSAEGVLGQEQGQGQASEPTEQVVQAGSTTGSDITDGLGDIKQPGPPPADDIKDEDKGEQDIENNDDGASGDDTGSGVTAASFDMPKEKGIAGLEFLKRPMEFVAPDIDKGLYVPLDTVPDQNAALALMNAICTCPGVPMSKSRITRLSEETRERFKDIYNSTISPFFQTKAIDFSGRTYCREHIAVLYCDAFPNIVNRKEHILSNQKVSLTEPHIGSYLLKAQRIKESGVYPDGVGFKEVDDCIRISSALTEYKKLLAVDSQMRSLQCLTTVDCPTEPPKSHKDGSIWGTPDKKDSDIVWVHPTIGKTDTFRYSSSKPNIQGLCPTAKSCIKAPKGYSLFSLDISAQDVYPLICGILENKSIMYKTEKYQDPYYAILDELSLETTPQNRADSKVPTLSFLNGKSWNTIEKEVKEQGLQTELIRTIYDYINNEPGYYKMSQEAKREANKNRSYRKGFFGSADLIDKSKIKRNGRPVTGGALVSAVMRKILNGNFQITSAEIFTIGYNAMMYDIIHGNLEGINLTNLCPVMPIHDEIIGLVSDDLLKERGEDEVMGIVRYYMLPCVEGWVRMFGKHNISKHYEHK